MFFLFFLAANTGKESQTSCPEKCLNSIPETPKEHSSEEEQTLKEMEEQKEEKMEVDEKTVATSDELNKNEASEKMDTSTPDITSPSEEKGINMETCLPQWLLVSFPVSIKLIRLLFCEFFVEKHLYLDPDHSC